MRLLKAASQDGTHPMLEDASRIGVCRRLLAARNHSSTLACSLDFAGILPSLSRKFLRYYRDIKAHSFRDREVPMLLDGSENTIDTEVVAHIEILNHAGLCHAEHLRSLEALASEGTYKKAAWRPKMTNDTSVVNRTFNDEFSLLSHIYGVTASDYSALLNYEFAFNSDDYAGYARVIEPCIAVHRCPALWALCFTLCCFS